MSDQKTTLKSIKPASVNKSLALILTKELINEAPYYIETIHNGGRNKVYQVYVKNYGKLILRISLEQDRLNDFIKEQWCWKKLKEVGVPMPEVLEVGNSIIPFPYMVVRAMEGIPGNRYINPDIKIYREMGKWAKKIHSILTKGYGNIFDWSHNTLSKNKSWRDYLDRELHLWESVSLYEEQQILTADNQKTYVKLANDVVQLKGKPTLVHGDYKLQNILVDKDCKIVSIIDWELAQSNIPQYVEFSHTFFDLNEEEKKEFLKGYGMSWDEYLAIKPELNCLYAARKFRDVRWSVENKDTIQLDTLKKLLNTIIEKQFI